MGLDGLLHLSLWQMVVATLVLTHITIVSVTVYLHRFSAHRALELSPVLQHFFRFWLWLTTGMGTRELEFRLGRSHTSRARSKRRRGRAPRPSPEYGENLFAQAASSELEKAR